MKTRILPLPAALALFLSLAVPAAIVAAAAPAPTTARTVSGLDPGAIDASIRPQDDFFRYVNGGWIARTPIPADRTSIGSFADLFEKSEQQRHAILEELVARTDLAAGSLDRKLADCYASYMDSTRLEARGIEPLRPDLDQVAAIADRRALAAAFGRDWRLGVAVPVRGRVRADFGNSRRYLLYLSQSGLGLPNREFYLRNDPKAVSTREEYRRHIARLLGLAGIAEGGRRAAGILGLERRLAEAQWPRADERDAEKASNKFAVADLAKLGPGFDWRGFLAAAGVPALDSVNVGQPSYFTAFAALADSVDLATWKDYLSFQVIRAAAPHLNRAMDDAVFDFERVIRGTQEQPARWKRGVRQVEGELGEAIGQFYVARHFPPAAKARVEQLVANELAAMRDRIDHLEWMSPATRQRAQEKLAKFKPYIGYPDKWIDYTALEMRRDDHFGNYRRATEFEFRRQLDKLGQPVDRDEWGMTPQTVNAYYSPNMNKIVFPAAILQPPFFDMNADDAVNYGGIGAVIGHEISHGFDNDGRKYDGDGNLRDWWTAADDSAFQRRADVLVRQYDAFTPEEGLHVNGRLTLGENIGDLSGLTIAYHAYQRSLAGKPAPVIDGRTGEQRLFLSFATIWRSKMRPEQLRVQVLSNEHSPSPYRVNGTLANMPEFYAAFGVKPGDALYRPEAERVKIW